MVPFGLATDLTGAWAGDNDLTHVVEEGVLQGTWAGQADGAFVYRILRHGHDIELAMPEGAVVRGFMDQDGVITWGDGDVWRPIPLEDMQQSEAAAAALSDHLSDHPSAEPIGPPIGVSPPATEVTTTTTAIVPVTQEPNRMLTRWIAAMVADARYDQDDVEELIATVEGHHASIESGGRRNKRTRRSRRA